METLVKNPKTGRWIKKDGTLYKKLKKEGVKIPSQPSRERRAFVPDDLKKKSRVKVEKHFSVDREDKPWALKKPHSKKERKKLLESCKKSCFLLPEKLKFPICNKISDEKKQSTDSNKKKTSKYKTECAYNCRGIKAAASRAGQWKYENVLQTAKSIATKLDCYKKK